MVLMVDLEFDDLGNRLERPFESVALTYEVVALMVARLIDYCRYFD